MKNINQDEDSEESIAGQYDDYSQSIARSYPIAPPSVTTVAIPHIILVGPEVDIWVFSFAATLYVPGGLHLNPQYWNIVQGKKKSEESRIRESGNWEFKYIDGQMFVYDGRRTIKLSNSVRFQSRDGKSVMTVYPNGKVEVKAMGPRGIETRSFTFSENQRPILGLYSINNLQTRNTRVAYTYLLSDGRRILQNGTIVEREGVRPETTITADPNIQNQRDITFRNYAPFTQNQVKIINFR